MYVNICMYVCINFWTYTVGFLLLKTTECSLKTHPGVRRSCHLYDVDKNFSLTNAFGKKGFCIMRVRI